MTALGNLPSGIVTFVFTDIEGSTRLFHRLGDGFVEMLERHQAILREAWEAHSGHEISVEGDSFFVAFATTEDAIAACAHAQRALDSEPWGDDAVLRVRMGIHRGLASPHEGGYVAVAVHQAKRVEDAAHGGQILVSEHAAEGVAPAHGFDLRPIGKFRVRDFPEPIRLYQVIGEGLANEFAAIRALPAEGHNIVLPATPTVGRERAIQGLMGRVAPRRTVTLTGPGGVGKSRLAAELGMEITPEWEDGVWLVPLSGVGEPSLVAGAVANAIGAPADPSGARSEDVLRHLETRSAMVVLDGCEHVAQACANLIGMVHDACEGVGFLATSREPLRARGEVIWPVDPLEVPAIREPDPALVAETPAGRLFLERAIAARPTFSIDEDNAASIAEICRHLDGLPLLIELAAARVSHQSPAEILAGLEHRFRLLRSRDPRLSERHQTVEALLDWSYRLLERSEQAALRRLSVFAASFSPWWAAPAVAGDDIEDRGAQELIWSLVDRSLVVADLAASATRYRLLETIRTYARRLLDEEGQTGLTARRLAVGMLEGLGPWLSQDHDWVGEMTIEIDNLRGLVTLLPREDEELAQQIACSIGRYHDAVQTYRDGIEELTGLARTLDHPSPARVSLLSTLAYLYSRTGQLDRAEEFVAAAEALRREHGSPDWDEVAVERAQGDVARRRGELDAAIAIARDALERPLGTRGKARMYNLLGIAAAGAGDFDTAYEALSRELELNEELGLGIFVASAHGNLAEIALRLGKVDEAARHQGRCLEAAVAHGFPAMLAFSLIVAARIAAGGGDWTEAVLLHSRAEALLDEIGLVLYADDQRESEKLMTDARGRLGEQFGALLIEGGEIEIPSAVDRAKKVFFSASQNGSSA